MVNLGFEIKGKVRVSMKLGLCDFEEKNIEKGRGILTLSKEENELKVVMIPADTELSCDGAEKKNKI